MLVRSGWVGLIVRVAVLLQLLMTCPTCQASQRQTLLKLTRTLTEKLQTTLTQSAADIERLSQQTNNISQEVTALSGDLLHQAANTEEIVERLHLLDNRTTALEERQDLDQTIWNYNNLVCNASLQLLREDLQQQIKQINESMQPVKGDPQSVSFLSQADVTTTPKPSGAMDLLEDLNNFLDEYDYYEEAEESSEQASLKDNRTPGNPNIKSTDFVSTLIDETNELLRNISNDYKNLSKQMERQEKGADKLREKMADNWDRLDRQVVQLKADTAFKMSRLSDDLKHGDDAVRREIDLKVEDIDLLKKITSSKLAVYESRLDFMEAMVMNISLANEKNIEQFLTESSQKSDENSEATTVSNNIQPKEGPDGPVYSMANQLDSLADGLLNFRDRRDPADTSGLLGSVGANQHIPPNPPELPDLPFSGRSPAPLDNPQMPHVSPHQPTRPSPHHMQRNAFPSSASSQASLQPRSNVPPIADRAGDYRSGRAIIDDLQYDDGANSCECSAMQERLAILESGFENMMNEVENQISGIQASVTRMFHQIQVIEGRLAAPVQPKPKYGCVATKMAASAHGMDEWCRENCQKGACSLDICSCPIT